MRGVQKEYAGRIDVVRVNVLDDKNQDVTAECGFNTTPEFYLLDPSGKIVAFWDGQVEPNELRAAFDAALPHVPLCLPLTWLQDAPPARQLAHCPLPCEVGRCARKEGAVQCQ